MMQQQSPTNEHSKLREETVKPEPRRVMGRPPLPREVARSERIATFVTKQQKAGLEQLAEATSLSISAVCHELIVRGLDQGMDGKTKRNK